MPVADRAELVELARVPVDVDRDHGSRPLRDRSLDSRRIEVPRLRIEVGEDRRRALVERTVRGCDERVRRRDHLVSRPDPRGDGQVMQSGRAARDRGGVRRADDLGECLLEALDGGAEGQPSRAEHFHDELFLALVEPGLGERDLPRDRAHRRASPVRRVTRLRGRPGRRRASCSSARRCRSRRPDTPSAASGSAGRRRSRGRRPRVPGSPPPRSRP